MAYERYGDKKYRVRRYNRFNFSDEEVIQGGLTKEQAEKMADRLQSNDNGLGATRYSAEPE